MSQLQAMRNDYSAPALEKGLDILECLATQGVAMSQMQLARTLGKGQSELFRMLSCLEKRGFIRRDPVSGAYHLTLRLFELSHLHSPFEQLSDAAARPMQELTMTTRESCHLSVLHRGQLLVLSQEESPERIRLSIEVGGTFSSINTVSGRLLLSYLAPSKLDKTLSLDNSYFALSSTGKQELKKKLASIKVRGFEDARSETFEGVYDIAVLIGGKESNLQAALAISSLTKETARATRERLLGPLKNCAESIAMSAGLVISE
jgi:DNA-binding IclR family transcriptional regulator